MEETIPPSPIRTTFGWPSGPRNRPNSAPIQPARGGRDSSPFGSTLSDLTYEEAVHLLFTQLPMFQRQGAPAYKANLEATKRVCRMLGNPEKHLKFVHVAGTNGKGTVSHMLAAAFQLSGHKVGLFSSPH